MLEDGRPDVERRFLDDGVAFAVLPALAAPAAPGLQERILWHEAVCALVPAAHPLATRPDPVPLRDLVREPLVVIGAPGEGVPEVVDLLARHGEVVIPTATADCPATVAALVRAGIGVGMLTGVAAHGAHVDGRDRPACRWPSPGWSAGSAPTGTTRCQAPSWAGSCSARSWPLRRPPGRSPLRRVARGP